MKMKILKPANVLLAAVILFYSTTSVYNAPTGSICGNGEPLPEGDQASRYDDALYVANKIIVS